MWRLEVFCHSCHDQCINACGHHLLISEVPALRHWKNRLLSHEGGQKNLCIQWYYGDKLTFWTSFSSVSCCPVCSVLLVFNLDIVSFINLAPLSDDLSLPNWMKYMRNTTALEVNCMGALCSSYLFRKFIVNKVIHHNFLLC